MPRSVICCRLQMSLVRLRRSVWRTGFCQLTTSFPLCRPKASGLSRKEEEEEDIKDLIKL